MRFTAKSPPDGKRRGRAFAAAGATIALAAATITLAATGQAGAAPNCTVVYSIQSDWGAGFVANLHLSNAGDPTTSWTVSFTFPGSQRIQPPGWSANWTQAAGSAAVTATNMSWNGALGTGGSTDFGFQATNSGANAIPANIRVTCTGAGGTTTTTTPTTTTTTSTTTTTTSTTTTSSSTTTTTSTTGNPPPPKVDNPFVGARGYVNPDWAANANSVSGGSRIANQPTAVWLDRIAAINGANGARGLVAHMDGAVQQAAGQPLTIELVIYDLPGRDCAALASNGELAPTDIATYEHSYIDVIAGILARPAYRNLRIVTIIEPDSLPNMVTNADGQAGSTPQCATMKQNGNYVTGVGYALHTLNAVGNVYNYIDAGHHAWLGWDSNFNPSIDEFKLAATTAGATVNDVAGFIVNTANYGPTTEPNFTINSTVNGTSVRQAHWIDFNNFVDEQSFAVAFRNGLVSRGGFPSNIGMLIDTSRNGWGGSARPTGPGPTTSVDDFVNGGRIDRRFHAGNWCNQSGAGLGARPTAAPAAGIDAYVWVKPPGESDGSSQPIPNDQGKGFDQMCDPTYQGNARNGNSPSGALPNSPLAGAFFPAQFTQLMANAFPPL
jgi:cellulose 1,4-beta-cellobiosidase